MALVPPCRLALAVAAAIALAWTTPASASGAVRAEDGCELEPLAAPEPVSPQPTTPPSRPTVPSRPSLRAALAERGIRFEGLLQLDGSANAAGGARRGVALRYPLGLSVSVETGPLLGWAGGRLHARWHGHAGGDGAALVGDFQGFDNLDAEAYQAFEELYAEQRLAGGRLRLKLGKVDANTEFAFVEAGGVFLNSAAGFSPTIVGLPTYPAPAVSVNAIVDPWPWLHAAAGLYRLRQHGSSERTPFAIGEAGVRWGAAGGRPGRAAAGVWRHDAHRAGGEDGAPARPASGWYALAEQQVVREPADSGSLGVFVQAGTAPRHAGTVDQHLGAGLVWSGAIPGRDADALGLLVSVVRFAGEERGGRESALECVYAARLFDQLTVKADLQYVANPGGGGLRPALALSLRGEIAF